MTYGAFAWKDLMRSALRDRSRDHGEPPTVFVPGQPVAAGYAGDARWSSAEVRIWMVETPSAPR